MSINPAFIREKAHKAHIKNRPEEAINLYKQLLSLKEVEKSEFLSDAINLGALLRSSNRLIDAAQHYHQWLEILPPNTSFSINAANCFRELKKPKDALKAIERARVQYPKDLKLLIAQAECFLDLGELNLCQNQLRSVIRRDSKNKLAWSTLGVCLTRMNQIENALKAFNNAQELDKNDFRMTANRISLLSDLGKYKEAEKIWQNVSKENKRKLEIKGALAGLKIAQNDYEEACKILKILCEESPYQPAHWLNLSSSLKSLKYTVAPHNVLKKSLILHPKNWELGEAFLQSLAEMGQIKPAKQLYNSIDLETTPLKDIHIFNRQFLGASYGLMPLSHMEIQAKEWEKKKKSLGPNNLWLDYLLDKSKNRRIKIGYLSSDFCNHPVARFMLPILKQHDKKQFEVWAINSCPHNDWITNQLQESSENWLDIRFANDQQAARLIADLRLDIIIELGGFTGGSRLGLLVHKPAPIQLSYLGYPAPTYLESIDGWIGDKELFGGLREPEKNAHNLINIPNGYMAFDSGGHIPIEQRSKNPDFQFGCFNHARKLTDETIKLFCEVIKANPGSKLVLKSISFHEKSEQIRIQKRFKNEGMDNKNLILLDWVKGGLNHLKRYSEIDVALDTIPYGGATTTCEALWMGVPVITLRGKGMTGRLSSSILKYANQEQWIANNIDEYIAITKRLHELGHRNKISRQNLREKISSTSMFNTKRLTQSLETTYMHKIKDLPPI